MLDRWRVRLLAAAKTGTTLQAPELDACAHQVARELEDWTRIVPRRVLNCTGTLLHTNIGRSPLSSSAIAAMVEAAGCCDLEVELKSGLRGSRMTRVCRLLARVLDVPDVLVVNNGAAAILLVCTALGVDRKAKRKGVVLSRGQMVEIGDGFRVATMMAAGGVPVIEVGSTNRTHAAAKVDALVNNGMDEIEIPAFLRKQAD